MSKLFRPEDITLDDLRYLAKDSFALWALTSGVKVDHNSLDFSKHRYLLPIYMDNSKEIVWRKSAQIGATIYLLLRVLWWLQNNQGRKAGLYFPTKEGVENLSKDRVGPLIESAPDLSRISSSEDKLGLRYIGKSAFYLYHLGGQASKDSVPLDFIAFDEVRLMNPADIDQALERISHSSHKYKLFTSTCGLPNSDIDARYQGGTQYSWFSKCGCPDGVNLAYTFPDCVIADDPRRKEPYLRCPKCKWEIKDPQNGRYVAMNPGAKYNSYHVSQLASAFISVEEIWDFYKRTTNMQEFYNAKLGIPYIDVSNMAMAKEDMLNSINGDLLWREANSSTDKGITAMGVDQGGGYCVVVIADIKDDKKRIRHIEIIEQANPNYYEGGKPVTPFKRLHELMNEYNVRICVCDYMPNYNDAMHFAQAFPGRVYLAYYHEGLTADPVQWNDRRYKESVKKAGPLLKFKYTVALSRFQSLEILFGAWRGGQYVMPRPELLLQTMKDPASGQLRVASPAEWLIETMPRHIRKFTVTNEETGAGKYTWVYTGGGHGDHLTHASNYCNVALERLRRQTVFLFA